MDEILRQLGELALGAVPTIIIFLFLWVCYRIIVHKPLARLLAERESKTTGAVKKAQADVAAAEQKTAEYEQRIREARLSVYKAQEGRRQQVLEARSKALAEAREAAHRMVQTSRVELEKEAVTAKAKLQAEGSNLAAEILRIILGKRVEEQTPVGGRP
jgi:F-type H+-transporting ATPase subunit b